MANINLTDMAEDYSIFTEKSNKISGDLWTRIIKLQGPYSDIKLSNEDINPPAVVIAKGYIHFNNLANSIDSTLTVEPKNFMSLRNDGDFISSFAEMCIKMGVLSGRVDYRNLSRIKMPDMINLFVNLPDNKPAIMSKEEYCEAVKNANSTVGQYFTNGHFSQHNQK